MVFNPVDEWTAAFENAQVRGVIILGKDSREKVEGCLPDSILFPADVAARAIGWIDGHDAPYVILQVEENVRQMVHNFFQKSYVRSGLREEISL